MQRSLESCRHEGHDVMTHDSEWPEFTITADRAIRCSISQLKKSKVDGILGYWLAAEILSASPSSSGQKATD